MFLYGSYLLYTSNGRPVILPPVLELLEGNVRIHHHCILYII